MPAGAGAAAAARCAPARHAARASPGRKLTSCRARPARTRSKSRAPAPTASKSLEWRLFDLSAYSQADPWDVPWGWRTIVFGMLAWGISFLAIGFLSIPIAVQLLHGTDLERITPLQMSEVQLIDQVLSTIVGVALVRYIGASASNDSPRDFLHVSPKGPFRKADGWLAWALAGLAAAPFAILAASSVFTLLPTDVGTSNGTVDAVAGLIESTDPNILVNLVLVTGVLAPILEESVFRGFLLTSLTKQMPVPAAVVLSSLVFAAAHLSPRDSPQLVVLGIIMGFAYCRSRNLLTTIVIHGAWNSIVVLALVTLVSQDIPLKEILGR